ncbi:hypothetical protein ABFS82_04G162100 [Erythranthe guttata]|uniref:Uncharacterized protein n=1 Tax=Erythranthe guttata TaxID=4155 RepID=A0A022QB47_ERYGU|nr:PREDICTED: putative late blight resistance protein homolog R1B-16 [Erythranthe guttata]EYU24428.1 hypothetical protein MIMGU_mgv1a001134mg [Erythranthe guttata]|eukprot:XP_012852937.1 PREDICTED: putative late blight resistance protein homolog R1B-16 [Erythranthe guttata]
MAAYAALVSLMNTIDQIQYHPPPYVSRTKNQIESLSNKVAFLLDFIETNHSHQVLDSQIASAAYAAEDVIEIYGFQRRTSPFIRFFDLKKVIQDMDSVTKEVVSFKEERGAFKDHDHHQPAAGPTYSISAATSSTTALTSAETSAAAVSSGLDDELIQLMERLVGQRSSLQIIPIVGMGGIGKTTLARNAYESRLILNHFDICAWAAISQEYSVNGIFSKLLSCQSKSTGETGREDQLGERMYKSLVGRRYLIVLDDMWSIEAWDKIKRFFPDNNNGSRVVVTTRLSNMATHLGSDSYLSMKFLDKDTSWKLFCEKAFPQEGGGCPSELEDIAKRIVGKCKGLPLLIVVIGAVVRKSSKTQEYLENLSRNMNSILDSEEQSLDILSLSYRHLPVHLKPCFLYMGIFPEDHVIRVSRLIKLWVVEGFIKPNETQTLEEVAEGYLKDLVDRNLIIVGTFGSTGKIKTCHVHDLLRDLCLKTAHKEKFLYVVGVSDSSQGINDERRIAVHKETSSYRMASLSLARSLISFGHDQPSLKYSPLLRVFNAVRVESIDNIFESIYLRCICVFYSAMPQLSRKLPSSVSLLGNLQMIIIEDIMRVDQIRNIEIVTEVFWEMRQLRHLQFNYIDLPNPPRLRGEEENDRVVLKNLQTLEKVIDLFLSEEVCKRIPNVKKLKIILFKEWTSMYCAKNLRRLSKLESLKCEFLVIPRRSLLLKNLSFPISLKKLSLRGCSLHWGDLTMIGSLPYLEGLVLGVNSVSGSEWDPVEGEFLRLKFLELYYVTDLKHWNADSCHFPVLEKLVLTEINKLEEIPLGIGEIPTLGFIELVRCSESAAISAVKILEEQESLGNEGLFVRIMVNYKKELQQFESFTSNNLHVSSFRLW